MSCTDKFKYLLRAVNDLSAVSGSTEHVAAATDMFDK